jgi:protein-L-isoaspartate(D-aspartate) O-methyltransferase
MPDSARQRAAMVESQLRTNDVTDPRILKAMGEIPRERFVPAALSPVAYMEGCVSLGKGRALLDPRCFAKLAQLAEVRASDRVLDVGCLTGYSTLVLSRLAAHVVGLEEDGELKRTAEKSLSQLGVANVEFVQGSLDQGCVQKAPFDIIFINGTTEIRPERLLAQLAEGGRLVAILRDGAAGHAGLFLKHEGAVSERSAFDAQVPNLPGFQKVAGFVF